MQPPTVSLPLWCVSSLASVFWIATLNAKLMSVRNIGNEYCSIAGDGFSVYDTSLSLIFVLIFCYTVHVIEQVAGNGEPMPIVDTMDRCLTHAHTCRDYRDMRVHICKHTWEQFGLGKFLVNFTSGARFAKLFLANIYI